MSTQEFLKDPWGQGKSHRAFEKSAFSIRPAPEFSTGEVLLSSLYRASGFEGISEGKVKTMGDQFSKSVDSARTRTLDEVTIEPDTWRTVLDRLVQSPKVAQQSSKRFLSLSPLVPDAALYSGAARLSGNPWNPGQLVKRMVQMGAPSAEAAEDLWRNLHDSLSVGPNDDVWARWLQREFEPRRPGDVQWQLSELPVLDGFPVSDRTLFQYPAKQFFVDLEGIISAKPAMTRRQWISLLEAVLRIGSVSHVLWLCGVNHRIWSFIRGLLENDEPLALGSDSEVVEQILSVKSRMLSFGHPAIPEMRNYASRYLSARLGMNRVLWALEDLNTTVGAMDSATGILAFLRAVDSKRLELRATGVLGSYHELQDREGLAIRCKKGVGANLVEFCQYTLGQRRPMDETLRGYDQGYFMRKRGEARNSQWVLALGPVAVLAMTHCCLHEVKGPRSVHRLAAHLGSYGIEFDLHGLNDSDLGRQLRMLGLVLDSPDAESGMLLVPPFAT